MPKDDQSSLSLTSGAKRLVDLALENQKSSNNPVLGVHHWLLALVERHSAMAESLVEGLVAGDIQQQLLEHLRQGNAGDPLEYETVLEQSSLHATEREKPQIAERDLAAVILTVAGYELVADVTSDGNFTRIESTLGGPDNPNYAPRLKSPTPALDEYLVDLTRMAKEGKLYPTVGRVEEIQLVIETLCRRTKRNPILIGPAGVGKTAIVEGLAQRVVRGEVPQLLQGVRIFLLQPSTLVAGAHMAGEVEKRMKGILQEASQEGIILFIDEVHAIIGAGGAPGRSDLASQLKPALARGDLACLAATTDDEFRRFIEPDAALERRFQPIRIQELTGVQTLTILETLRDEFKQSRKILIGDQVLKWIVDFSQAYMRNRRYPDKSIDLLDQCVAYAITNGKQEVTITDAEKVSQRMVGMPLSIEKNIHALNSALTSYSLLSNDAVNTLINRLEVTLRGLDILSERPNAVVMLIEEAAGVDIELARIISAQLYGSDQRVIAIDFSSFVHEADVNRLIGSAPGYVGYEDANLLDQVVQMPWSVLVFQNIDACHPQVLDVLVQGLNNGFISTGRGRRIYLSDTVILLTAGLTLKKQRPIGFGQEDDLQVDMRQLVSKALGVELVNQVDLVSAGVQEAEYQSQHMQHLMDHLSERYLNYGINLRWDDTLVDWLFNQPDAYSNQREWERFVEDKISPYLIAKLKGSLEEEVKTVLIKFQDGQVIAETLDTVS